VERLSREVRMQDQTIVSIEGTLLRVGERSWHAEYPVSAARIVDDCIVAVIYEHIRAPNQFFANLAGFTLDGKKLWVGEHSFYEATDSYVSFWPTRELRVWNFACYTGTIDPKSGRLQRREWSK
jgi:hypothetical protein